MESLEKQARSAVAALGKRSKTSRVPTGVREIVLDYAREQRATGVSWQEIATTLRERSDLLLQDYLVGLGGGDVTPDNINAIIDDLNQRQAASPPEWKDTSQ